MNSSPPNSDAFPTDSPQLSDDVSEVTFSDEIVKEGTLQHHSVRPVSEKRKVTKWHTSYFVLKQNCLYFYDDAKEDNFVVCPTNQEKCNMSVQSKGTPSKLGAAVGYEIVLDNGEKLSVAVDTLCEFSSWMEFFCGCVGKMWDDVECITKTGWLLTCNTPSAKWEKRWFEIADGYITWHKRTEKGFFPLCKCIVEDRGIDIVLTSPSNVLVLRVVSGWSEWLHALHDSVKAANLLASSEVASVELTEQQRDALELQAVLKKALAAEHPRTSLPSLPKCRKVYRILSIDGGGMRGIISAILLQRLTAVSPDLLEQFDLITGTSNGALISMSLAFGYSPLLCRTILEGAGKQIFKRTSGTLSSLNTAKFSNSSLKFLCDTLWGNKHLRDSPKKVVIPAMLLDNHAAVTSERSCEIHYFHNLGGNRSAEDSGEDELVRDIVMRTTAAPTFFPSYQQYVDGGMFAQDPSSAAVTFALSPRLGYQVEEIYVFSVGTGKVPKFYEDPNHDHDWGYVQWLPKLLDILWDGMVQKSEYACRELLGDRYWRVNPQLQYDVPLDNPLELPTLVAAAEQFDLAPSVEWLRRTLYA
eukprot:TRINITY_DN691_c0_g1_i7.p1 TRINITY_DN691_c0_g1~~TRINITY_DN691_c0_g1_i7.p1  ORF type:complete len:584 (+),score=141.72 TRINITY_DN691_c0_g1_i7:228-1979(+)